MNNTINTNLLRVLIVSFIIFSVYFFQTPSKVYAVFPPDPSWTSPDTSDFEIWKSSQLTWDAGSLVCSADLTDTDTDVVDCLVGTIEPSVTYRVQAIAESNTVSTVLTTGATGGFFDHVNVNGSGNWAGTSPTLGSCGFKDFDNDDTSPVCSGSFNGNDVRLRVTSGTVTFIGPSLEGFMYLITTGSDVVTNSTSYLNLADNGDTPNEISSKITITAAAPSRNVMLFGDRTVRFISGKIIFYPR